MTLHSITALFDQQTWALIALVLALSCVMLGVIVLLQRRNKASKASPLTDSPKLLYGQDEAMAATLQAAEAMTVHQELLDELGDSLKNCIEALETASLEPIIETSLDEVSQQLDQAHSILNTLSHQLATQHADDLNRHRAHMQNPASSETAANISTDTTTMLEDVRALQRALARLNAAHHQNTQWHDQPSALRHQDSMARLHSLQRHLDALFNTLHQSNEALDQTTKALDALSAQNARRS